MKTKPCLVYTLFLMALMLGAIEQISQAGDTTVLSDSFRRMVEADWVRQEEVSRQLTCDSAEALHLAIDRGRSMIADMRRLGAKEAANEAQDIIKAINRQLGAEQLSRDTYRELYFQLRWAMRKLAFQNPALDFDELLFVKRQWPKWNHQCSHRVGEAQIPGANLCILKGLAGAGEVRSILSDRFSQGGIGRPDLSYDGQRIVFPFAAKRSPATKYGYGKPGHRGGMCYAYDLYEVDVHGNNLQQLTFDPKTEDTEPIYTPDGRIAFMTSRDGRLVQCGDWALACGLYSMNTKGGDLRQITEPKEGEFYPNMLQDGRIMYTRWDYLMKGYNVIQQLWSVYPDGTKASLLFGDHFAFSVGPIAFQEARQIWGTSKVLCVGGAHHNTGVGPIMIVDIDKNRGRRDAMQNVTPEIGYPEINARVLNEVCQTQLPGEGISTTSNETGWYSSPYPLTEEHYLVAYSYEKNNTAPRGYGLYLMDVHGNKELIFRAKDYSCYSPIPLKSRPKPHAIADTVKSVPADQLGTAVITDIYQGLEGVARGEVKYLRVLETYSKLEHTEPQRCDVGVNSGWDIRAVLGTVPVEEDGSVHFYVPPHKQLFFEVLDKDFLEIRRMRNFFNVMPGEFVSCTGCHESTSVTTNYASVPRATQAAPLTITPPPWGTEGLSFAKVVQPVLDQHCVQCHDGGAGEEQSFDLRGQTMVTAPIGYDRDQGRQHQVSDSFLELLPFVSYIRVGGYQGEKLPLPANATGSRQSKLMKLLKQGHYDVSLPQNQWRALAAWIDCNAQFYGSWDEISTAEPAKPVVKQGVELLRDINETDRRKQKQRLLELQDRDKTGSIVAYINCGLCMTSSGPGPEVLTQHNGKGWIFCEPSAIKGLVPQTAEITFASNEIIFDIEKLQKNTRYKLGLTWWDYNASGRIQSIWLSNLNSSESIKILDAKALPAYTSKKQLPDTILLDLPHNLIGHHKLRITIKKEAGANAVLSEIWLEKQPLYAGSKY